MIGSSALDVLVALEAGSALKPTATLEAYRRARQHVFPSRESMAEFVRLHGPDLVASGALLKVDEAWHVRASIFDAHVHAVGSVMGQGRDW